MGLLYFKGMETIRRDTESYLFDDAGAVVRPIPFYELSIEEWVVYEMIFEKRRHFLRKYLSEGVDGAQGN